MPVDPNIPLQAGQNIPQFGMSPQAMMSMATLVARLDAIRQQNMARNALRDLYSNPANLGPGGMPTPHALSSLMGVAPEAGLQLQGSLAQLSERAARAKYLDAMMGDRGIKDVTDVGQRALGVYDAALASGMSPQQAQDKAQREVYGPGIAAVKSSGLVGPDVARGISPQFDPVRARGELGVMNNFKLAQQQAELGIKQKNLEYTGQRTAADVQRAQAGMMGPPTQIEVRTPDGGTKKVWARLDRGVAGAQMQYMDAKGNAIDPNTVIGGETKSTGIGKTREIEVNDPKGNLIKKGAAWQDSQGNYYWSGTNESVQVPAGGAINLRSMQRPRSASAMYTQAYIDQNPNATPAQIAQANAEFIRVGALDRDFASGPDGRTVIALNTVANHLPLFRKYAQALDNGSVPAINAALNAVQKQTGHPEITNYTMAKDFLADEVARVLVPGGSAGAVSDREQMKAHLMAGMSPQQLAGGADTATEFVKGKLGALRQQYARGDQSREKYFDEHILSGGSRDIFSVHEASSAPGGPAPAPGGPGVSASAAPPAAIAYLRAHPDLAPAFDAKYGSGAAARAMGQQ